MQKVLWVIAIGSIVFMGVAAYFLVNRLTNDATNLIAGFVIGMVMTSPAAAAIGGLIVNSRMGHQPMNISNHYRTPAQMPSDPYYQIMQAQQMPQTQTYQSLQPQFPMLPQRRHIVIGDDGEAREL